MSWANIVLYDRDEARRTAIYRALAASFRVIPVGSIADLGPSWPASAWFLVHQDDGALEELQQAFGGKGLFSPIVAYGRVPIPRPPTAGGPSGGGG